MELMTRLRTKRSGQSNSHLDCLDHKYCTSSRASRRCYGKRGAERRKSRARLHLSTSVLLENLQHEHVTGNAVAFSPVAHLRGFPDTPQRESHFSEGYNQFLELLRRERCPSRHLPTFYLCFSFSFCTVCSQSRCVSTLTSPTFRLSSTCSVRRPFHAAAVTVRLRHTNFFIHGWSSDWDSHGLPELKCFVEIVPFQCDHIIY